MLYELLQHKKRIPQQTKIPTLSIFLSLVTWWTSIELWKTASQQTLLDTTSKTN